MDAIYFVCAQSIDGNRVSTGWVEPYPHPCPFSKIGHILVHVPIKY